MDLTKTIKSAYTDYDIDIDISKQVKDAIVGEIMDFTKDMKIEFRKSLSCYFVRSDSNHDKYDDVPGFGVYSPCLQYSVKMITADEIISDIIDYCEENKTSLNEVADIFEHMAKKIRSAAK